MNIPNKNKTEINNASSNKLKTKPECSESALDSSEKRSFCLKQTEHNSCSSQTKKTNTTLQKEANPSRSKIIRTIWGGIGILCFGLGALGAVLPLIPTTPFILLAAFCLARSSKKLNDWFKSTKLYKTVLESYVSRRTMTVSAKLKLLIPVTVLLGISFALMSSVPVGRAIVAIVLLAHYVYFGLIVKTEKKEALA